MPTVDIYMKSGNKITLKVGDDFSIGTTGGQVTRIGWGNSASPAPLNIRPEQIEAVIQRR